MTYPVGLTLLDDVHQTTLFIHQTPDFFIWHVCCPADFCWVLHCNVIYRYRHLNHCRSISSLLCSKQTVSKPFWSNTPSRASNIADVFVEPRVNSNSPVWCVRHCAVKCVRTWLMISISSLKATDDLFAVFLWRVRCHVRTSASETEALALPVREFGTVCRVACEHLTSATNILKHYWH